MLAIGATGDEDPPVATADNRRYYMNPLHLVPSVAASGAPASGQTRAQANDQVRYSALILTYSWDRSVVQMVSLHWPRPSSIRMVISSSAMTLEPCSSV